MEAGAHGPQTLSGQKVSLRAFGGEQRQQEKGGSDAQSGTAATTHPPGSPRGWPAIGQGTGRGCSGPRPQGDLPSAPGPRDPGDASSGIQDGPGPVCGTHRRLGPDSPESPGSLAGRGGRARWSRRTRRPRAHPFLLSARRPLGRPSPPVDGKACRDSPVPGAARGGAGADPQRPTVKPLRPRPGQPDRTGLSLPASHCANRIPEKWSQGCASRVVLSGAPCGGQREDQGSPTFISAPKWRRSNGNCPTGGESLGGSSEVLSSCLVHPSPRPRLSLSLLCL